MMMCCSCPPCLEAATHQCVVLFLLYSSLYGCLTFSLYLLTACGIMAESNSGLRRGECSVWQWCGEGVAMSYLVVSGICA